MKKQSKKLRRVGLWGFALVYFLSFISIPLLSQASAQSTDEAVFIDKVFIEYDGRYWKDDNPYDDTWNYQAGPRSGVNGCGERRHSLDVQNPESDRPTATGYLLDRDEHGDCVERDFDAEFETDSLGRRTWNAYRRSADELFLPIGSRWNVGDCAFGDITTELNRYLTPSESDLYRRGDSGARNRYEEVFNDGGDEFLEDRNAVETTSESRARFRIYGECYIGLGAHHSEHVTFDGIVLAYNGEATNNRERCIPRVHGIEGGACAEGGDPGSLPPPGGGGEGDTARDECEDNAAEEGGFGWIICDLLRYGDNFTNELLVRVRDLLTLNERDYNDPDGNLREAWSYFRNIASFALIIIGLVMVIGQATSKE